MISYVASYNALPFTVALQNSAILRAECPHASLDLHIDHMISTKGFQGDSKLC